MQYAKTMGVGDVPSVPSLALGSGEVTLQSMTAAYAAFANHGLVPTPMLIRRVEDRDGTRAVRGAGSRRPRAISDTTAFLMSTMLADVINAGTATARAQLGFTLPAAGKTGTTNDYNDAWFVGFTPKLVTGVWVGFDQPRTILPNGFAADVAVPVWAKFMKTATQGDKPEWFIAAGGRDQRERLPALRTSSRPTAASTSTSSTTRRPDRARSMVYTEYFARGTEPTAYCDQHPTRGHHDEARAASSAAATSVRRRRTSRTPVSLTRARRRPRPRRQDGPPPREDSRSNRRKSAASGRECSASARSTIRRRPREAASSEEKGRRARDSIRHMPFRDVVGHRPADRAAVALDRRRHAAAESAVCRPGRRR